MAREIVATDDFAGAAGVLDAAWTAATSNYLERDGAGVAAPVSSGSNAIMRRNSGTYGGDQYAMVEMLAASASENQIYLAARASGATSTFNAYVAEIDAGGHKIYKVTNNTYALVGTFLGAAASWVANDKYWLEVANNGSNQPVFSLYKNLNLVGVTVTDTGGSPHTSGYPGGGGVKVSGSPLTITAWEGGNIVTAVSFTGAGNITNLRVRASAASGAFGTVYRITGVLGDPATGVPRANLTGLNAAFFDQATPAAMLAPTNVISNLTTDGSGNFSWLLPASALTLGQTGLFVLYHAGLGYLGAYRLQMVL